MLSYSVIWAYSVSDFEKCTILFRYFSLLCYLELQSISPLYFSRSIEESLSNFRTISLSDIFQCFAKAATWGHFAYMNLKCPSWMLLSSGGLWPDRIHKRSYSSLAPNYATWIHRTGSTLPEDTKPLSQSMLTVNLLSVSPSGIRLRAILLELWKYSRYQSWKSEYFTKLDIWNYCHISQETMNWY